MRTNTWLTERLIALRNDYFSDIPVLNTILVRFGRQSKTRFGSIIARPRAGYGKPVTYITINALFKDLSVPEYVIDATLAHEFTHYAHGFHSPLEKKHKYPHKGGVVDKEIKNRGIGHLLDNQNKWIKQEYKGFLQSKNMI